MEKGKGAFYRIHWLWNIIRNGLFLYGLTNRLAKIGIDIDAYYWELEGLTLGCAEPVIRDDPRAYTLEYLEQDEIVRLSDRIIGIPRTDIIKKFEEGNKCIGLRHESGEIAAYMFISTQSFVNKHRKFELDEDEAYLLAMYTFEEFRGKNLAPYLRYKSYELLWKEGRKRLYSLTVALNKSSLNFKKKLNVEHLKLFLYIGLFNKVHWNFLLKTYGRVKQ